MVLVDVNCRGLWIHEKVPVAMRGRNRGEERGLEVVAGLGQMRWKSGGLGLQEL